MSTLRTTERLIAPALLGVLVLLGWWLLTATGGIAPTLLPSPVTGITTSSTSSPANLTASQPRRDQDE